MAQLDRGGGYGEYGGGGSLGGGGMPLPVGGEYAGGVHVFVVRGSLFLRASKGSQITMRTILSSRLTGMPCGL